MTVPRSPDEHENPAPGGGWISGPMADPPEDARPAYSPTSLVLDICDALKRHGISINPGANVMFTASIACADVLRALGVKPETSPERRRS